jgi:hypothetical protein
MKREEFLRLCGGMFLVAGLPEQLMARMAEPMDGPQALKSIRRITIAVGATKPFKALHLSDTHLTRVDSRDGERKHALAASRQRVFPWAEHYFAAAIRYARERDLMILHTGDLQDFVSEANLDFIAATFGTGDWYTSAGNHEFSQYVGGAKENAEYKAQSYDKVQAVFPNDLTVASRVINGVNFVAIDNVYYYVTAEQHKAVEREFEKGLPVVLLCHIPFYTPKHCHEALTRNGGRTSYMVCTPPKVIEDFRRDPNSAASETYRNRPVSGDIDQPTLAFYNWLKEQSQLKAIICGHMHEFYEEQFSPTAKQYTVGANYFGYAQEIEFI